MFYTITLLLALLSKTALSANIPAEWQMKIDSYNAFYANDDTGILNPEGYPVNMYLPLIGNGYISHAKGVRSDTMYVSGVFNGETTSPSHRARIPATLALTIPNTTTTGVLFDIENGIYTRRGSFDSFPANSASYYELRWFAHRSLRNVYVNELYVHLEPNEAIATTLTLSNNYGDDSTDIKFETPIQNYATNTFQMCGSTLIPETTTGSSTNVCLNSDIVPSTVTFTEEDTTKTFITVYRTSLDSSDLRNDVANDYNNAKALADVNTLRSQHISAWQQIWQSGIEIEGRPDVAIALNASLAAVLSSVRSDWPYGLAPGGLTNYYNGHSFWDTETWMYPPLLFLHPEISKSLMEYRFNRLDGARQKGASYTPPWSGTQFPWESAFSGVETCPTFAATGLREDHINGDIAIAIWQEWMMRGDQEWLKTIGWPMLNGIADFWVSRSVYQDDGKAHILDIIPPDEYVDHVNDSVYSNYVAIKSLQYAVSAASILNVECAACAKYSQLANDIVILFDSSLGIHPEYANYPGDTVKQADVVLLHYPLGMEMDEKTQAADLEFYSARTDHHGPAMTWGMHAIGYLDLGDYDNAAQFFNMSFQDNMHDPLQVWTETPDGNAVNFITGAGGFLQTMISGFPGLRITDTGALTVFPTCPEGAKRIKVRGFQYHGATLNLEYSCSNVQDSKKNPSHAMKIKVVETKPGFIPLMFQAVKKPISATSLRGISAPLPKLLEKGSEVHVDLRPLNGAFYFTISANK